MFFFFLIPMIVVQNVGINAPSHALRMVSYSFFRLSGSHSSLPHRTNWEGALLEEPAPTVSVRTFFLWEKSAEQTIGRSDQISSFSWDPFAQIIDWRHAFPRLECSNIFQKNEENKETFESLKLKSHNFASLQLLNIFFQQLYKIILTFQFLYLLLYVYMDWFWSPSEGSTGNLFFYILIWKAETYIHIGVHTICWKFSKKKNRNF